MAINVFVTATFNANTGANPPATVQFSNAAGASATLSWDSAVITTESQLRQCVALMLQQALSQLTGP